MPLGAPGWRWVLLGAPGCSWVLLGAPGCSWVLLGAPGWGPLGSLGVFEVALGVPWWPVILQDPLEIPVVPLGALEMPWWLLVIAGGPQYGEPTWTRYGFDPIRINFEPNVEI